VFDKHPFEAGAAVLHLPPFARADGAPAAGEQLFRKCLPCHPIGPEVKNKVGPQLNGLDGQKAGTAANYSDSNANKNSGITWNKETFERSTAYGPRHASK
jgi:cytochrome c